ncbi:leucine-rich single-pass membrane protein 1-like isoform X2 [Erpetoichthys calabaricus]|uniref:leucine-rich single-pass membrane protein 1-like isoform X2 n=1 Tax=Erpetoichthys calabaricus TaxID=27687 RepID=UPI0010A0971E|nr:leucine-rich single-pass membrane protein 1-like isoform X2 [Erpetoichthys calabaricus]
MNDLSSEIDLDVLDEEGKLYTADSLNNLNKLNVCIDPQELLSDSFKQLSRMTKENEHSPLCKSETNEKWLSSSRCLCILLIVVAVALVASLLLSCYAVILMVETTEKMDILTSTTSEEKYLAELSRWRDIIKGFINQSRVTPLAVTDYKETKFSHSLTDD